MFLASIPSDILNVTSLIASIASLVLAVVAIWLSFKFFELSGQASKETTQAARDIEQGVSRLEALFEKMYADTFSMFRDSYADMREHAWPKAGQDAEDTAQVEAEVERRLTEIRDETAEQIANVIERVGGADQRMGELQDLVMRAVEQSRATEHEVRAKSAREAVLLALAPHRRLRAGRVLTRAKELGADGHEVFEEFERLRDEGLVDWDPVDGEKRDRWPRASADPMFLTEAGREELARLVAEPPD